MTGHFVNMWGLLPLRTYHLLWQKAVVQRSLRVIPLTLGKLDRAKLPDFLRGKHALSLPRELAKFRYACDELARQLVELRDESARIKAAA